MDRHVANTTTSAPAALEAGTLAAAKQTYIKLTRAIETLDRQFLRLIETELDRLGVTDVNGVQGLIMSRLGEREASVGDIMRRGYYIRGNVSYNLQKLADLGYLIHQPSAHDRRSALIRLSKKGLRLHREFEKAFERHVTAYARTGSFVALEDANATLHELGLFWGAEIGRAAGAPVHDSFAERRDRGARSEELPQPSSTRPSA